MSYLPGYFRQIDGTGRITIPKEVRNALELAPGDSLECSIDGNSIRLTKIISSRISIELARNTLRGLWRVFRAKAVVSDHQTIIATGPGVSISLEGNSTNPAVLDMAKGKSEFAVCPITLEIPNASPATSICAVHDDLGVSGAVALLDDVLGEHGMAIAAMLAEILSRKPNEEVLFG